MLKNTTPTRTFVVSSLALLLVMVGYIAGYHHDRSRYLMMDDTTVLDSYTGAVYTLHSKGVLQQKLDGSVNNRAMRFPKSSSTAASSRSEEEGYQEAAVDTAF